MNRSFNAMARSVSLTLALLSLSGHLAGQAGTASASATIEGKVCGTSNQAIAGATVILEATKLSKSFETTTDAQGHFRFSGLSAGTYRLRARRRDFKDVDKEPIAIAEHSSETVVLVLEKRPPEDSARSTPSDLPYADETHFTVAGVTDTTSLGGHGSDPVRRNSDALSKDAAGLSNPSAASGDEAAIRRQLSKQERSDLRFQLAEIEEKDGRSLDAVNDYERAAQLDRTEAHLFAWGAELLLHRAFDPSIEVFSKGRRLYPDSLRMILGLGAATYAKGSSEVAQRLFLEACDVAPSDPTPYLFLGRVQGTESTLPKGWVERLKRFVELYPKDARAHYFYAVALIKEAGGHEPRALAESELKTAIDLNAKFGDAYLELGVVASQQGDLSSAIVYLQQAVTNTPFPDDAHYRLAQVYRRMGDSRKAREETELYKQISEKKNQQIENEHHELQQFIYTLRGENPAPNSGADTH